MDVLNFISWIKNGQQVTTIDPEKTLLPLGLRDPRRDDGYRSGTITAQDFINSVAPPAIVAVGNGAGSTVRTGLNNTANGACSVVFGFFNKTDTFSCHSVISGGSGNCSINSYSVTGGGLNNFNERECSVIAGGAFNGQYGNGSFIGAGSSNAVFSLASAIVGGQSNTISSPYSFLGSGQCNIISNNLSGIVTGLCNVGAATYSFIGGGLRNIVCNTANRAAIVGGQCNRATFDDTFLLGSCINTNRACTAFVNNLSIMDIPTSSAGLPSKAVWSNAGVLTIVP
jgi:hypothetical protein